MDTMLAMPIFGKTPDSLRSSKGRHIYDVSNVFD
jgi:hypothetical protein